MRRQRMHAGTGHPVESFHRNRRAIRQSNRTRLRNRYTRAGGQCHGGVLQQGRAGTRIVTELQHPLLTVHLQ